MSSVALDKIVPFGQDFVFDDMPCTLAFKKWVTFFLCLIDSSVDRCEHGESRFGCRPGRQFACLLDGVDDGSTPGIGDLREEPVFYGVPLGAVRWIMSNADVDANLFGQFHKPPLEQPAPCVVRATTIAKYEYGLCAWIYMSEVLLPLLGEALTGKLGCVMAYPEGHIARVPAHIVDAVRHHLSVGERGIIVVIDLYRFCAIGRAIVPSVRAKKFLLLGVNTEYGNAVLLTVSPLLLYIIELLVAHLAVCHSHRFQWLATGEALSLDYLPDYIWANLYMVLLREYPLDFGGSQTEPFCIGILRKPRYIKFYYLAEYGDILGMLGERALPATSLLADSALFEVLTRIKFMGASVDGVTRDRKNAADKTNALPAVSFSYDGSELSRLPLVQVLKVLHLLVCYYICWIIRNLHNCLEFSYKGTNFSADLRI